MLGSPLVNASTSPRCHALVARRWRTCWVAGSLVAFTAYASLLQTHRSR
jgi:hypothetical protein